MVRLFEFVVSEDWVISSISETFSGIVGQPTESFVGKRFSDLFVATARDDDAKARLLRSGRCDVSLTVPGGLGIVFDVMLAQSPSGYRGTAVDVTYQRAMECDIQMLGEVFRHSSDGILITDEHQCILTVNKTFCDLTGYTEFELTGSTPAMLRSDRHDSDFYQSMHDALATDGYWAGEVWNRRKNGDLYPQRMRILAHKYGGITRYIGIVSDISERMQMENSVWVRANFDHLTGAANRFLVQTVAQNAISETSKLGGGFALVYVDMDRFKHVNDTFGHESGDRVLVEVVARLNACVRSEDTVARIGGDEFLLILRRAANEESILPVVKRAVESLKSPLVVSGRSLRLSASFGIVIHPKDGATYQDLLRNADLAMYAAKAMKNGCYTFFNQNVRSAIAERMEIEQALHHALDHGEIEVHYQPVIDGATGRIVGCEALARWRKTQDGMTKFIPPATFIPVAEESGLIHKIGEMIFREACRQGKEWHDAGFSIRVGINVSGVQFSGVDFASRYMEIVHQSGILPEKVQIEITESVLMSGSDSPDVTVDHLVGQGIGVALDDFGTGYSSLSYLRRFAVNTVKIDRSFVLGCHTNREDASIVASVVSMAHALGLRVTAEGVESEAHVDHLRSIGVDCLQGYYYSRPVPAHEMLGLLRRQGCILPALSDGACRAPGQTLESMDDAREACLAESRDTVHLSAALH